jgi:hypothetical protein
MSLLTKLVGLDAFGKASDEYRLKTKTGAIVSIISVIIILYLLVGEIRYFYKEEVMESLYVNTTRAESIVIDFDLSFPSLPCALLSVDAVDDHGLPIPDAVHEVYKHRLDTGGVRVGGAERQEQLGDSIRTESQLKQLVQDRGNTVIDETDKTNNQPKCGNCYGAGRRDQCCNTCQDVKDAYARLGWHFKPQGIVQCAAESALQTLKEQNSEDGGCQVYGRIALSRTSGHFHIAPHQKMHDTKLQSGVFTLLDLLAFTFDQFNVSHTVNSLSFGDHFPGIKSPLDGQVRMLRDTHGMQQYFIKVVPTRYVQLDGSTISSNQYSVTEHMSHLAPGSGRGLPGVYFYYEVSPIQSTVTVRRPRLLRFLTSLCAIVGGAFSLMGMVDLLVGLATRQISRQHIL